MHGFFDEPLRLALAHEPRALFAQAAFVAAVLPVDLLIFLAAGELHLRRVDDDDVIAGVDERGVGRLVLALEQARGPGGDAPEHLAVGVDEMPAAAVRGVLRAGHERRHSQKPFRRKKPL